MPNSASACSTWRSSGRDDLEQLLTKSPVTDFQHQYRKFMLFNRKIRNRRLGREHVLDVKLRSSQVRAARTRVFALTGGISFAVLFCGYVLWRAAEWGMDKLVYENKAFAVEILDIQTDGSIPCEQLRRWAGVRTGQNLFALDLTRVRRDLEMVPLIQSVSIERILPHTLRLRVIEREAIAQITVPRTTPNGIELSVYQLDSQGWIMVPLDPRQRSIPMTQPLDQLPLLVGVKPSELLPARRLGSPQVQAALQLIEAFERSSMNGWTDLKSVDVSANDVLLVTTGQGTEITFGLSDLDQQLRRWQQVFDMGQRTGKAVVWLDLAVSNNIPARLLEASVAPPLAPKAPKPPHSRKKHV
jgi:cell division septal protein FtsQ